MHEPVIFPDEDTIEMPPARRAIDGLTHSESSWEKMSAPVATASFAETAQYLRTVILSG